MPATQPGVYGLPGSRLVVPYKQLILASRPLSYWPHDEQSGTTNYDVVRGLNSVLSGSYALATPGPSAALPRGVSFTGGVGTVSAAIQPSINAAAWLFWFKGTVNGNVLNTRTPDSGKAFEFFMGILNGAGVAGTPFFGVGAGGTALGAFAGSVAINDGKWHQLAGSWDDPTSANFTWSQVSIYVDGRRATTSNGDTAGSVTVPFGSSTTLKFADAITCSFAHAAFYDRPLTAADVLRYYVAAAPAGS